MRIHLNFTPIKEELEKLERQSVTAGVLDTMTRVATIDHSKGTRTNLDTTGSGMSYKSRYVREKGRRTKGLKLRELAIILDRQRGIISKVLLNPNNRELVEIAQDLAILNKTPADILRLENSAIAMIRNPILRKDYGKNARSTVKGWMRPDGRFFEGKGFDHYGIATGTLFKNIKARYKKW